jgi:hypothetical protein
VRPTSGEQPIPRPGPLAWTLIGVGLVVALSMIVLAATYSGGSGTAEPVISGGPVDGGGDRNDLATEPLDIDPIEAFLPRTGEGSTCTEAVGVDLIPGFSAVLTINGTPIPVDQMNGYTVNDSGVREATAGSSLGEFSWGPEADCPRGDILRPQDNRLEACVYRNIDGPESCRVFVHTFDAL